MRGQLTAAFAGLAGAQHLIDPEQFRWQRFALRLGRRFFLAKIGGGFGPFATWALWVKLGGIPHYRIAGTSPAYPAPPDA
jgi:hypothetical protein